MPINRLHCTTGSAFCALITKAAFCREPGVLDVNRRVRVRFGEGSLVVVPVYADGSLGVLVTLSPDNFAHYKGSGGEAEFYVRDVYAYRDSEFPLGVEIGGVRGKKMLLFTETRVRGVAQPS